ncbi:MAG: pyridoxamine 5'-phosphate oxidase family protein [Kineosporiaceae bacterium]
MVDVTTAQVWDEVRKQTFAVVGMVSARGAARTAGIVYTVDGGRLFYSTVAEDWKTRHVQANPSVSVTVLVPKSVPLLPWIKVPPATITFAGTARVLSAGEAPAPIVEKLLHGLDLGGAAASHHAVVEVTPTGDFVTYGVGVSARGMLDTEKARGRAPVG